VLQNACRQALPPGCLESVHMFMLTNTHTLSFSFKNLLRKRRPVGTLLSLRAQMCRDNTEVRQLGILLQLVNIPIMSLQGDFVTLPPSTQPIHKRTCTPLHTHTIRVSFGEGLESLLPPLEKCPLSKATHTPPLPCYIPAILSPTHRCIWTVQVCVLWQALRREQVYPQPPVVTHYHIIYPFAATYISSSRAAEVYVEFIFLLHVMQCCVYLYVYSKDCVMYIHAN